MEEGHLRNLVKIHAKIASAENMKRNMRGHGQYTKVIVSSKEVAPIYANAFG